MKTINRWLLHIFFCFALFIPAGFAQPETLLNQKLHEVYVIDLMDNLYLNRDIYENLAYAQNVGRKAIIQYPDLISVRWRLARNGWAISEKESNPKKRLSILKESIQHGKIASEQYETSPDAHLWYAVSLGKYMLEKGIMQTLIHRNTVKQGFERVLELDSENDVAFMGLALLYSKLPSLLGGDKQLAIKMIDEALKIDPYFTRLYLTKAEIFFSLGRHDEARTQLERIIQMKAPSVIANFIEDRLKAKRKMKENF